MRRHLSYANVMATVALFIALGGSSYAALKVTGKNVKNGSLTGKDIKNSSLGTTDVKNKSLLAKDFKGGQIPVGPRGATGAPGAPGSAVAYAAVSADGTLDTAHSKNVPQPSTPGGDLAYHCLRPTVPVKSIVATVIDGPGEIGVELGDPAGTCPAGTVATVKTYNSAGMTALPLGYYVVFN
jgi:hypothetical protein